jgi:acetyltransferase-like isoleucine patch superfamily enzyme
MLDIGPNGKIEIGDNSVIRYASQIRSAEKISIGSEVIIANNVYICDHDSHPTDPQKRIEMCQEDHEGPLWDWCHANKAPISIEDNVWIGRYVTIMKGVTIGKGSIVASNTVVTKDVSAYSLCYGNPGIVKNGIYKK